MKKINKFLSVVLAPCLGISCFAGCKDSNTSNKNSANSSGNGIGVSIGVLVDQRTSDYSIVVSTTATITETTAAKELQTYLYDITGAMLPIVNDGSIQYNESSKIIYRFGICARCRQCLGTGF